MEMLEKGDKVTISFETCNQEHSCSLAAVQRFSWKGSFESKLPFLEIFYRRGWVKLRAQNMTNGSSDGQGYANMPTSSS